MAKLAIVQKTPVFLDKDKTIARAVGLVKEAAGSGAGLVIFSEAFIPRDRLAYARDCAYCPCR